jgi:predicted dehydrogenase
MPPIDNLPPTFISPQQIVSDNDNINIGSGNQIIGGGGNPSPVNVTQVTTVTYTALPTDYFLCVDVAAPVTITLPTGTLGAVYIVKDCDGDASANAITIQGTGGQLVDGSNATINTSYGAIQFIFNGVEWSIV